MRELVQHWNEGLSTGLIRSRLAKTYSDGKLNVGVWVKLRNGHKICTVLQRESEHRHVERDLLAEGRGCTEACKIRLQADAHEHSVLVRVVEGVEIIEQVIPSTVWFQRFDERGPIGPNLLYLSLRTGAFKSLLAFPDRKRHICGNLGWPESVGYGPGYGVKGAAIVSEGRVSLVDQIVGDIGKEPELSVLLSGLRVTLNDNLEGSFAQIVVGENADLLDTLIGPFDFLQGFS